MNRKERRKLKKQMPGQRLVINTGTEPIDRRGNEWCHLHNLNLDDIDHPTERDKRLIESIRYQTRKYDLEDGTTRVVKQCPRCFGTVEVGIISKPLLAE